MFGGILLGGVQSTVCLVDFVLEIWRGCISSSKTISGQLEYRQNLSQFQRRQSSDFAVIATAAINGTNGSRKDVEVSVKHRSLKTEEVGAGKEVK